MSTDSPKYVHRLINNQRATNWWREIIDGGSRIIDRIVHLFISDWSDSYLIEPSRFKAKIVIIDLSLFFSDVRLRHRSQRSKSALY